MPEELKGKNDAYTAEYIKNPDWVVHATSQCEKNPLRGWICTTCWEFGHSAAICEVINTYGADGNNGAYRDWARLRRRDYWAQPMGDNFKKNLTAQIAAKADPPAPHECMA